MIKVDVVKKKDTTTFIFETKNTTPEGLDELDEAYSALLGSRLRRGGYLDSNRFEIEVLNQEDEPS